VARAVRGQKSGAVGGGDCPEFVDAEIWIKENSFLFYFSFVFFYIYKTRQKNGMLHPLRTSPIGTDKSFLPQLRKSLQKLPRLRILCQGEPTDGRWQLFLFAMCPMRAMRSKGAVAGRVSLGNGTRFVLRLLCQK